MNVLNSHAAVVCRKVFSRKVSRDKSPLWPALFMLKTILFAAVFLCLAPPHLTAQQAAYDEDIPFIAIRTETARHTLETFLLLRDRLEVEIADYLATKSPQSAARMAILSDQFNELIDLDAVPTASRRETGITTTTYLLDILGRIPLPDLDPGPDGEVPELGEGGVFQIPGTPLRIEAIETGERQGDYVFSANTIQIAPRFFSAVSHLPLETSLNITSFSAFGPQLTGPMIPAGIYQSMPPALLALWLDTPLWKVIGVVLAFVVFAAALLLINLLVRLIMPSGWFSGRMVALLRPLALLTVGGYAIPLLAGQINVSGDFAALVDIVKTLITYLAYAWLFRNALSIAVEMLIHSPLIKNESLDANLLRLIAFVFGIVGIVIILAFGAQAIGLPILSVLAGLGVGGLAVALALRPTLENLIGGVILYIDRPVTLGDFCRFGDLTGTVEKIGLRSTSVRALDRTLISIPNAQFVDMQIVNFAHCDEMLLLETLGLRYETDPDQLRYVLATLRKMLHAHPRINPNTVRVRFSGYGDSALNIEIRVYVMTREWNDFFAVREDIYLRIYGIIRDAGTGFAFPSRAVYSMGSDNLDVDLAEEAKKTVRNWRASGKLPFPRLSNEEIERLNGSLDYPPMGSSERAPDHAESHILSEPLSAAPSPVAPPADSGDNKGAKAT